MGGFVPLLVFSGGEFWPPLAVVMAGGVGLSVILSLVLTPALVTLVVRRRARQRAAAALPQAASVLLLLLLAGCAVGPDYEAPVDTLSDEWIGAETVSADEPLSDWWRSFDDPLIEQYVETALTANRDLRVAGARLREARALREQARSLFLPNVNASLGYNRFTLSEDSPFLAGSGLQGAQTSSLYDAGFDAAWEVDVFGGIRRRNEVAVAVTEATEAFVDAVRLSIIAEVVRGFAELRGFQRRLEVAERNLRLQDETLTLVEGRVASGLAPELDALNARAQLYATRSTLPQLEAAVQSSTYRLATLTARPPEELLAELSAARSLPVSSAELNPGLRGEVLRRRPDIAQAERQLAAASAEIGVAVAEMFPKFVLSGNFGWQAQEFNRLAESATQNASIVPGVSVPLFAGGRLRAQVEAARARHEAALAGYEQAVLLAIEESEGALVRYGRTLDSRDELAEAASASAEAADVAGKLYDSGLADFLNVLDADRRRLLAEDELVVRQTETLINLVAVYKALGAG
jgi:multidrug efflux system outer membrane protein